MNSPFYRNYSKQQPSHSFRSVPVQQKPQRSSPKVVSVPVHFVSSDQPRTTILMLKDAAAVKIQKVFRGFVVRKSVRKIGAIRNEVGEVERRIEDVEVVDLIRRDEKERLRVNETLMSLLFKLDSIRGVDSGVRDLRKAVTRKAIALQEKVDSIGLVEQRTLDSREQDEIEVDSDVCTSASDQVTKASDSVDEIVNNNVNLDDIEVNDDGSIVKEVVKEVVENNTNLVNDAVVTDEVEAMEASPSVNSNEFGGKDEAKIDMNKQKEGDCTNYAKENREFLQILSEFGGKDDATTVVKKHKEGDSAINTKGNREILQNSSEFGGKDDATTVVKKHKEGDSAINMKGNREILENLVDDNEKMMKLMSQISETNDMQTRMINSLSRRVEQLEKALVTERQRKKKKTQVSLRRKRDQDCFTI